MGCPWWASMMFPENWSAAAWAATNLSYSPPGNRPPGTRDGSAPAVAESARNTPVPRGAAPSSPSVDLRDIPWLDIYMDLPFTVFMREHRAPDAPTKIDARTLAHTGNGVAKPELRDVRRTAETGRAVLPFKTIWPDHASSARHYSR